MEFLQNMWNAWSEWLQRPFNEPTMTYEQFWGEWHNIFENLFGL